MGPSEPAILKPLSQARTTIPVFGEAGPFTGASLDRAHRRRVQCFPSARRLWRVVSVSPQRVLERRVRHLANGVLGHQQRSALDRSAEAHVSVRLCSHERMFPCRSRVLTSVCPSPRLGLSRRSAVLTYFGEGAMRHSRKRRLPDIWVMDADGGNAHPLRAGPTPRLIVWTGPQSAADGPRAALRDHRRPLEPRPRARSASRRPRAPAAPRAERTSSSRLCL